MDETPFLFVLGSFVVACSAKVERLPRPGESLRAASLTVEAGGKGLNLAVGARRLGARVDGLLPVGTDPFAALAAQALARDGLPDVMIRRYPGSTGGGVGFTDAASENCLAVYPGANLLLSAAEVRAVGGAIARAGLVLAQFETGDAPIAEAFAIARGAGVRTLLNPSPFRTPNPRILANTSILVLNRVEAVELAATSGVGLGDAPCSDADLIRLGTALLGPGPGHGPELVVVTLGADGTLACRAAAPPLRQPAFPVAAVDSLGAGDAFAAGLAASLLERRPLEDCLRRAAACGAMVAASMGVFEALPTTEALERFLGGRAEATG